MLITFEFNSVEDSEIVEAIKSCANICDTIPINFGIGGEKVFVVDSFSLKSGYGEFYDTKVYLSEVTKPKSKEQLAAENAVKKAKEALEAAEEALKIASGKL